jgi:hypothetical protein
MRSVFIAAAREFALQGSGVEDVLAYWNKGSPLSGVVTADIDTTRGATTPPQRTTTARATRRTRELGARTRE